MNLWGYLAKRQTEKTKRTETRQDGRNERTADRQQGKSERTRTKAETGTNAGGTILGLSDDVKDISLGSLETLVGAAQDNPEATAALATMVNPALGAVVGGVLGAGANTGAGGYTQIPTSILPPAATPAPAPAPAPAAAEGSSWVPYVAVGAAVLALAGALRRS